jgi:hypothetical protein
MFFQDVPYGLVGYVVANVGQRALDSIVSPGRILSGELQNKINNDLTDAWPADVLSIVTVVSLLSNELSMPTQYRVGCEQRANVFK